MIKTNEFTKHLNWIIILKDQREANKSSAGMKAQ